MGKAVGHHASLAALLQTVIADRLRRIQRLLQVAGFQPVIFADVVAPDAGEAVRLQLHFHRQMVDLRLAGALLHFAHFRFDAEQILHVVSHLMRDYVALRELAARAELVFHLVVE